MKCFNCGKETEEYLCTDCRTEGIFEKIFEQIRFYKPETCENPYLAEYAATLTAKWEERNCIPAILSLFPAGIAEYYQCVYYHMCKKQEFEGAAINFLDDHYWVDKKSQNLIRLLVEYYLPDDFVKPYSWCQWISGADGICCELYAKAAEYFAMIGEYDLSDQMVAKGLRSNDFIYSDKEKIQTKLEEQKAKTQGYRVKGPYWPKSKRGETAESLEARRRAVAMFYDEKGISYPRIESKPAKVPENEFAPVSECLEAPEDYCAFWCAEAFSVSSAKPIYQIAAVKVENGKVIDEFQSFIRPWDANKASRESAAKEAGVPLSVIEGAEDVDQVMTKFFAFVGDLALVSTDALGNQLKLLCRATRYAGMKQLPNELYDLLDLAGETDSKFDFAKRPDLLQAFDIAEGTDALGKAKVNIELYKTLKNYRE